MKTLVAVLLTLTLLVGVGTFANALDNGGKQVPRIQSDSLPLGTPTETVLLYTMIPAPDPVVSWGQEVWGGIHMIDTGVGG